MKKYRKVFTVLIMLGIVSCGGGSGSDDTFSGSWKGQIFLTKQSSENCKFEDSLDEHYEVTRNGSDVTVTSLIYPDMHGQITSDSSFKAGFYVGSGFSPTTFELTFENVDGDKATAKFTDFQGSFTTETGLKSCTGTWEGEVRKQ